MMSSVLAAGGHSLVDHGFSAWAAWLVLFMPLAVSALVLCVPAIRKRSNIAAALAISSVLAGFLITVFVYFIPSLGDAGGTVYEGIVDWVVVGKSKITFGTRLDHLSLIMTLIVTGIGSAIFVYALGYMHGDPSMGRFYGKFSLFVFSMLGIVLSPNFFQTFIFWELVGASSYLLIGYYWKKHSAGEAAKKAFLTNRVGDFGFLLGILMIWAAVGSAASEQGGHLGDMVAKYGAFDFSAIRAAVDPSSWASSLFATSTWAAVGAILVFCGAMGKSAQFPLHVWLPDAMEGPTPVSALMHAATMVAAGIYMIIRCFFVIQGTAWASDLIAWIGGITAVLAASMAIVQSDIKKVLAYSTLSQLGYMTLALGLGAYTAAMFHLTTHAFFKALLFLCAGSVIHGCHHEQNMFKMGGLKKFMPSTHKTWVIGTLALCGIFPLAGFWSKDEILGSAHTNQFGISGGNILWLVGTLVAFMTAFYMGRAWFLTFGGKYRGHHEPHESPKVMTGPLWVLAIFSLVIGFIGIPNGTFSGISNWVEHYLHDWHVGEPAAFHMSVAVISLIVAALGLLIAKGVYGKITSDNPDDDPMKARLGPLWTLWSNLYYIDDFYLWLVRCVQQGIAKLCWLFERKVLIGASINSVSRVTRQAGDQLRRVQTGRLGGYVTSFVVGTVLILIVLLVQITMGKK